jgi:hypothetical protein
MGDEDFAGLDDVKHETPPNTWVDLHVTCTELWPAASEKMAQVGRLADGAGADIKFMAYETSNVREFEQGDSYVIRDAMAISDDQESRAILLKADTHIEDAKHPIGGSGPNGPACPECGEDMPIDAYHEDGMAPEIGWEYWHCPHCDAKMRPEAIHSA